MASKRLCESDSRSTRKQMQAFIDEIKLISALKHPSIVAFQGAA